MSNLSQRQQTILNRVVDIHINTAQPVSSKTITERFNQLYRGSYSSATVRHDMGVLEEQGYLTHPHTSAGRVPTDSGYRFYIDHGLPPAGVLMLEQEVEDLLSKQIGSFGDLEVLAEEMAQSLSELSGEMSLILYPVRSRRNLREDRWRLVFHGSACLMKKPEFQDFEKLRGVLECLESRVPMIQWFSTRAAAPGVRVFIGSEHGERALSDCSMITASISYERRGGSMTFAILGPRRMRYSRALCLIERAAALASRNIENLLGEHSFYEG